MAAFREEDPYLLEFYDEERHLFLKRDIEDGEEGWGGSTGPAGLTLGNQWVGVVIEKGSGVEDYDIGERLCGYGGISETHLRQAVNNPYLLKVPDGMLEERGVLGSRAVCLERRLRDSNMRRRRWLARPAPATWWWIRSRRGGQRS